MKDKCNRDFEPDCRDVVLPLMNDYVLPHDETEGEPCKIVRIWLLAWIVHTLQLDELACAEAVGLGLQFEELLRLDPKEIRAAFMRTVTKK